MGKKKNNFKKGMLIAGSVLCSALVFADSKYISPDSNGVQDALEIPFKIKDKSRVTKWSLVIEDSAGNVIRTIGNKVALPTRVTARNMVKQIMKKKEGVEIPPVVTWDGTMDNGETAPDGEYFYYFSATDARENTRNTAKYSVVVDNTRPEIMLTVLPEEKRIFGEGDKIKFDFGQKGSKEDLWKAQILDNTGKAVRNYSWTGSEPQSFSWNGTDDKGIIVPDGVYKYVITCTDRAGNTSPYTEVSNIIFSAEKPVTNIVISGNRYFSVPQKSSITSVKLAVSIPEPRKDSGNSLVGWSVDIVNEAGQVVRSYNKKTSGAVPPSEIVFDGKNGSGKVIPEGNYCARVTAEYLNGYKTPEVRSPLFTFDTTAPSGMIELSDVIFSPDGDGNKDTVSFLQTAKKDGGAPVQNWHAKIVSPSDSDAALVEYDFGPYPPKNIVWNGLDKDGKLVSDGDYIYVLSAEDLAGNKFEAKSATVKVDTSKTEVMLAASTTAFSPTGDSTKPSVSFTPVLKAESEVTSYVFEVKNADGNVIYAQKSDGPVPPVFVWDGSNSSGAVCDDGIYTAVITTMSENGSEAHAESHEVVLDTQAPYTEISIENLIFSPDGDSRKDSVIISAAETTEENLWSAKVVDASGTVVKTFNWNGYIGLAPADTFSWDGTDDNGNKAADGEYSVVIESTDLAGNTFMETVSGIVLDRRETKAYVTASLPGISPVSATGLTEQTFTLRMTLTEGIDDWTFAVCDEGGNVVAEWNGKGSDDLPKSFTWNGRTKDGKDCEGKYRGKLTLDYVKGNHVESSTAPFICSVTPPQLAVNTTPQFFSPDNDGVDDDLFIKLTGITTSGFVNWSFTINNPVETGREGAFWKTSGTDKITEQIIWNGLSNTSRERDGYAERIQSAMDYPWVFTATDRLGMTSTVEGVIPVDILVIRDGDVLKMAVPSIIFRSNHADFKTADEAPGSKVTKRQAANNERVLKRVAEVLKKFPDYTVTVTGHANNLTGTEEEETSTANGNIPLVPLSKERAEFVKSRLVEYGVESKRLSVDGKGGRQPVVPRSDVANWWKNRRVEFILHK